ncbi:MAG: hypothetical protein DRP68_01365 [Candidatus Omnitrophota bacterium]|nr:MAG: hypothetical protein DRP68_01365 [Candidatus Omnitrophota bacterium]RKY38277.1 MAG: hypothetical protein DRP72_02075 [Candidatus Omnitrophota bacterium]HDN85642.1 PilZ domain-containing protein [Candidatus Omnitrophota bacterium]
MEFRMNYEGKEKREGVRWYENIASQFIFFSDVRMPGFPKRVDGKINNLSALGIGAEVVFPSGISKEALFSGMIKMGVKFNLPNSEEVLKAICRVIWMNKRGGEEERYAVGLEFIDISLSHREKIVEYVINSYLGEVSNSKEEEKV